MKEFIDKLIERLKKLPHAEEDMWIWLIDAEVTIRELAEEYKVSEMQTGWIPCSERLPEEDKRVLCQGENYMFIGFVDSFDGEWTNNHNYRGINVKAWCELPAPYTEGE